MTGLDVKKFRSQYFFSRTKCKDSCDPSEKMNFPKILVRISKIQPITPFVEFSELNTRLLAVLKIKFIGRYH